MEKYDVSKLQGKSVDDKGGQQHEGSLRLLLEVRNRLHALWLNTGSDRDKRKFVNAGTKAGQAVRMLGSR